ncbi:MAG: hypothetical protein Q9194_006873 [Teloschistes cf. exilis]
MPKSHQPQTASAETELPRKITKRVRGEEINGAPPPFQPIWPAKNQQDTPEVAEIKQRIRALLPAFKLNGRTKLSPKVVHDNTLYTSSSPAAHNAVLVYNYMALNIYIVADLSDNIIPVEKAVRLAVKGQGPG